MAKCATCQSETGLYMSGSPICMRCAGLCGLRRKAQSMATTEGMLRQQLTSATERQSEAARRFDEVMDQFSSDQSRPESIRQIKDAAEVLSAAREATAAARNRFDAYLSKRTLPDHLQPKWVRNR